MEIKFANDSDSMSVKAENEQTKRTAWIITCLRNLSSEEKNEVLRATFYDYESSDDEEWLTDESEFETASERALRRPQSRLGHFESKVDKKSDSEKSN